MLFQKKINRAFQNLHEEKEEELKREEESGNEIPQLEKNDFLAMVISAFIVILPVIAVVFVILGLAGYFFFFH